MRYEGNRMMPPIPNGGYGYDNPGAQTWNPSAFGGNHFSNFGGTGRVKTPGRGRSALPQVSVKLLKPENGVLLTLLHQGLARPATAIHFQSFPRLRWPSKSWGVPATPRAVCYRSRRRAYSHRHRHQKYTFCGKKRAACGDNDPHESAIALCVQLSFRQRRLSGSCFCEFYFG